MPRQLSLEQRCKIAAWQEVYKSPTAVQREFEKVYGRHSAPARQTIHDIHAKFMETGSVLDRSRSGRRSSAATDENVEKVEQTFSRNPRTSIRRVALELDISKSSIQRMLKEPLILYPYKIQVPQKLEPQDYDARLEKCETLLHHFQNDSHLMENLWFCDESIFHLSGRVNRHNCRIWRKAKPTALHELERDSPKLVVWAAISASGLIGPFFFINEDGNTTNVTGENCLRMLQKFAVPELQAKTDLTEVIFQ